MERSCVGGIDSIRKLCATHGSWVSYDASIMNPESALHAEKLKTRDAVEQVNELTEKLTKNPDSISERERLARLLA